MHQSRDHGITNIKARHNHRAYGMGLGVILFEEDTPGFPGDVRNPSGYPFPIQYEVATGIDHRDLIYKEDKSACLEPILRAAKNLERMGCRAIAAECGYFAYFQREVASHVRVPVFLSSLLQLPLAQQLISPDQVVGILVWSTQYIRERHFTSVGIRPDSNYVIAGMVETGLCHTLKDLARLCVGNYADFEKEMVATALAFKQAHPNMGALLLECSVVPPFARAVQRALDMPVFSWGTLLDYAYSVVVHREYYGHV